MLAVVLMLAAMGCWLLAALLGGFGRDERAYLALGLLGALLGVAGALAVLLGGPLATLSFPFWGGPAQLGVDALSAAFLLPLHLVAGLGIIYGKDYLPMGAARNAGRWVRFFYGLLVAAMTLVFSARQGVLFLMGWEVMALAALFLIGTAHEHPEELRATWVYLVCTHLGSLLLLAMVVLLAQRLGSYAWLPFHGAPASSLDRWIFIVGILGFGFKAGLVPLHFWLPAAHAGSPSHVSALLSAVMLKTGVYGVLRLSTLLPPVPHLGGAVMVAGALTALAGVASALAQRDYKRLLAYSSVENLGIIFMGVGLGLTGRAEGNPWLTALGFGGAVFHVWNHALFKSLLFLGAGSVQHTVHTRDMETLGGLGQPMPRTALLVLPGVLAVSALPPFNGFLSEWFLYRGFFAAILGGDSWPAGLTLFALALTGGLAGVAFGKFYGFLFLGLPRSARAREAQDPPAGMWIPMAILAGLCLALSLGGRLLLPLLDRVLAVLAPGEPARLLPGLGHELACLGGLAALLLGVGAGVWGWLRLLPPAPVRPGTWDCGYAQPTARMQISAGGFADGWAVLLPGVRQRVRRIRELFPRPATFTAEFRDAVGEGLVAAFTSLAARRLLRFRRLQQGHLSLYLLYILVTLVTIFLWMLIRPRLLG